MRNYLLALTFLVFQTSSKGAELTASSANPTPVTSAELSTEVKKPAVETKILGAIEVRPSYGHKVGEFHTENAAFAGYQFSKTTSLVYKQEFNTNLYDPRLKSTDGGMNLTAIDGYLRGRVNNITNLWSGGPMLSYEGRVYMPTFAPKRDAGYITTLRNYAKLAQPVGSGITLTFEEVPMFHIYNRAGTANAKGGTANPWFENRIGVGAEANLGKGFKLLVPFYLSSAKYRAFANKAKNNNAWAHKVWLYPELTYALTPNTTVGAAYYSDNLIKTDFSDSNVGDGLEKGITQLIMTVTL